MRGEIFLRFGKDWISIGELKKVIEIYEECV